jgi:hypothetical protein
MNYHVILPSTAYQNETIDAKKFEINLISEVLPKLSAYLYRNSVLMMDNALAHNFAWVKEVCQNAGVVVVFLLLYFSPIEIFFNDCKP